MKETIKNLFKQMIIDFHDRKLPSLTPRELDWPKLPAPLRKAIVLIGMRRSGKTWAMYQHMEHLQQQNVPPEKMLYINFEDDRLMDLKATDLTLILDAYFELYPHFQNKTNLHFFFDEIHEAPHWEKFIRRLLDTEKMSLTLSGSSAKLLSKEIATSLRGRTLVREIFPFDFSEYLLHKKISVPTTLTSQHHRTLIHHATHYLQQGGFPEAINASADLHRELLQGYIDSVIYRDIIERYRITNTTAVKKLLADCLQNPAALFSINKAFNALKSQGYAISKDSMYEFMDHFEDAYCLFSIPIYSLSHRKTTLNPKKIYPIDMGLITAYAINNDFKHAARLETAVFIHLRRHYKEIFYYRTEHSKEVDFLTIGPSNTMRLYQVCLSLEAPATRAHEISALQQAMSELTLNSGIIVTLDNEETMITPEGTIQCIPIWKFLLMR